MRPLTTKEFTDKANIVHNNKYDYTKTVYVSNKQKVTITCKTHGDFTQRPTDHMKSGCGKCALQNKSEQYRSSRHDFIKKAENLHGGTYDYSKVVYIGSKKKVIITCKTHGNFEQTPKAHMQGQGCPVCGRFAQQHNTFSYSGWEAAGNASEYFEDFYLYVLIMTHTSGEKFLKIGKTFTSLNRRYAGCQYDYILYNKTIASAKIVSELETKLKASIQNKYTPSITFAGSATECYSMECLDTINTIIKDFINEQV